MSKKLICNGRPQVCFECRFKDCLNKQTVSREETRYLRCGIDKTDQEKEERVKTLKREWARKHYRRLRCENNA